MVNDLWKDKPESVRCALAAPTGLAAFNIDGVTIHRLFQLPIEHDSKTSTYWALPKESLKVMRNGFKHLKLIIIDEVSMLSSLSLAYIHLRLEQLFGGDQCMVWVHEYSVCWGYFNSHRLMVQWCFRMFPTQ